MQKEMVDIDSPAVAGPQQIDALLRFYEKFKKGQEKGLADESLESDIELSDFDEEVTSYTPCKRRQSQSRSRRSSIAFSHRTNAHRRTSIYEISRYLREVCGEDKDEETAAIELPDDLDQLDAEKIAERLEQLYIEVVELEESYTNRIVSWTEQDLKQLTELLTERSNQASTKPEPTNEAMREPTDLERKFIDNSEEIGRLVDRIQQKMAVVSEQSESYQLVNSVFNANQ